MQSSVNDRNAFKFCLKYIDVCYTQYSTILLRNQNSIKILHLKEKPKHNFDWNRRATMSKKNDKNKSARWSEFCQNSAINKILSKILIFKAEIVIYICKHTNLMYRTSRILEFCLWWILPLLSNREKECSVFLCYLITRPGTS